MGKETSSLIVLFDSCYLFKIANYSCPVHRLFVYLLSFLEIFILKAFVCEKTRRIVAILKESQFRSSVNSQPIRIRLCNAVTWTQFKKRRCHLVVFDKCQVVVKIIRGLRTKI